MKISGKILTRRLAVLVSSLAAGCSTLLLHLPVRAASSGESASSVLTVPQRLLVFLGTSLGRSLLVLFFFLLIVLVLRALFGPRGRLRDPKWDELNRKQKLEDLADKEKAGLRRQRIAFQKRFATLGPLLEHETKAFRDYVRGFLSGDAERDAMFLLKEEHSLNVLEHAVSIAAYEPAFAPPELSGVKPETTDNFGIGAQQDQIMLLAALYHDLGRFEQLKRFNTFRDADSNNHAKLSASILRDRRFLADESDRTRGLVRTAVLLHNRFALPASLQPAMLPICQAVRDADKLDIMRVMSRELSPGHTPDPTVLLDLADEPAAFTPEVLQSVCDNKQVLYRQMCYVNDFRLLLCSWLPQLTFRTSKRILARSGHLRMIMQSLPDQPEINQMRGRLNTELESLL